MRRWELRQALEERAKRERSERLGARVMRAAAVLVFIGALWAGWGIVRESMRAKAAPAVQPLPSVESLLRQGRVREALEVQEIHDAVVAQELMREAARD